MTVLAAQRTPSTAPTAVPGEHRRARVRAVAPPTRGELPTARPVPVVPLLRVDPTRPPTSRLPVAGAEPAPAQPTALPDPTGLCCALARGAVEAIRGDRPVAQLARSVTPEILDALSTRAVLVRSVPRRGGVPRPVLVRRARVVRLGPGVAEATVVVDDVDRVRAAAIRVEAHRGRWRAVALEIG